MEINPISLNYNYKVNSQKMTSSNAGNSVQTETPAYMQKTSFRGFFSDIFTNKFDNKADKAMYDELNEVLSGKDKTNLNILYKTGKLLNRTSNDNSSTLENLYKIYKNPRIPGLDNEKILSDTIERIANPFIINQKFGKISHKLGNEILKHNQMLNSDKDNLPNNPKKTEDMNIDNSASCVAASIEFSLADKKPAEFARFAEGFSSPAYSVNQNVNLKNLNNNTLDAFYLFNLFNVKPQNASWDVASIKIAPDRDAIIRARVQNTQYNGKNRASIDVLMQSAFMQLGSQKTYNSLTDKRYGSLNTNNTGLTEFEKTFVESIVSNDGEKTSVVYQNVDSDSILQGYFHNTDVVSKHLINTLNTNRNVIVGITETDENKKIIGGHEITIIGYKMKNNELYFVYNDTDDNFSEPIIVKAEELLPKIHHAGIPIDILGKQPEEDRGLELLKQYNKKTA